MNLFQTDIMVSLKKSLDATLLRHEVIANNIANADTPGYKRLDITFKAALKEALKKDSFRGVRTNKKHIPIGPPGLNEVKPSIFRETDTFYRNDRNNVDIDFEMGELSKNSILYNTLSRLISEKYSNLETSINGRF